MTKKTWRVNAAAVLTLLLQMCGYSYCKVQQKLVFLAGRLSKAASRYFFLNASNSRIQSSRIGRQMMRWWADGSYFTRIHRNKRVSSILLNTNLSSIVRIQLSGWYFELRQGMQTLIKSDLSSIWLIRFAKLWALHDLPIVICIQDTFLIYLYTRISFISFFFNLSSAPPTRWSF